MDQQVVESNKNSVGTWGHESESTTDILIPAIKAAQSSSNGCKEGVWLPGQLVHTTTKEVLAEKGKPLEVLPILCVKSWEITSPKPMGGGFAKFIRNEPITSANDSDKWNLEKFEDQNPVIWHKVLTFLVLPVSRMQSFPFYMHFKASDKNGGKMLSTIMAENRLKSRPGPGRVVSLTTTLKTYNTNSWFVVNVSPVRDSTDSEIATCKRWFDLFHKAKFQEDCSFDEGSAQ